MTKKRNNGHSNARKEETSADLPKDNPLLRSKKSNIDKVIGSEGQILAKKRLAAIKRAQEMPSSESENAEAEKSSSTSSFSNGPASSEVSGTDYWEQLGPSYTPDGQTYSDRGTRVNVTGRVTAIVPHPVDPNTLYIGAAQGGVWKTPDGGKKWIATSDYAFSLAIGALAVDENNPDVLYAGTGEGNFSGDSQYGLGLIKTTNGGQTWESKGIDTFISSRFCRIAVSSKNNSNTLFAATTSLAVPEIASGIYRSIDGGESWTRMEGGLPPISTLGATDMVLDPNDPDIAYCAFWGEGIYKTTNASASNPTWSRLTSGLPASGFTRVVLAISKSSPNTIYALMASESDILDRFYKTSDGGNTWNRIKIDVRSTRYNGVNDLGGQGFYNINLAVHPQDQNIVYLSGISIWMATFDPNTNKWKFSDVGKDIHPDNHAFAFDPENPQVVYAGNDGGIYRSKDGGKTWDGSINQGLCITQFEFMEQHPTSDKIIFAGTQDNGTIRYEGNDVFHHAADGDGGFVCIDSNQPDYVWHTYYGLSPELSGQRGDFGTWQDLGGSISQNESNFYPPLTLDKTNPNNIAIGGKELYLDNSKGRNGWPDHIDLNLADGDLISAINYVNSNLIYVGTNLGHVYRLNKQANNWTVQAIHRSPFPRRYIWDIANLPNDESKVIAVVSGFGTPHVFHGEVSSNGGGAIATWTDISGTGDKRIPDIPGNAIAIDDANPTTVYVGTDVGVFRTVDAGRTWTWFSKGLPNCQIYDMRLYSAGGFLRVATHGRGMWQRKVI